MLGSRLPTFLATGTQLLLSSSTPRIGISLPHYAAAQHAMGVTVARDQLQAGDLVFFRGLGHMGMYVGGGNFVHAPQTGDVVKISNLNEPYRVATWVGARRVL